MAVGSIMPVNPAAVASGSALLRADSLLKSLSSSIVRLAIGGGGHT